MRILHVTPYFEDAWAYGGIPRAAAATVRGLAARGHEVTVCTTDACRPDARLAAPAPAGRAAPAGIAAPTGIEVHVFRNVSNAAAYRLQFFVPLGMRAFLRQHAANFDVAHLHGCHHLPGAMAARRLRRAGVPYVVTPHGTAPYLERRRMAKRLFDLTLGRGILEGASRVIAVSEAERQHLVRFGVAPAAIDVVPNPLDLAEFEGTRAGAFRTAREIPRDAPLLLFLGKLTAQKRIDVLLEAFAALQPPHAQLIVAGNDMGAGAVIRERIERLGIAGRVHLPGLLAGAERLSALADADVVVYPSQGEVFGLVPVEALLCGTPVIVSDDSGCGDVIRTTGGGLLVPPGDVPALRTALEQVLANLPAWRTQAAAARTEARRLFASERVCASIEAVYRQVAPAPAALRMALV